MQPSLKIFSITPLIDNFNCYRCITYAPHWIDFLGIQFEVLLGQLQRSGRHQFQIRPASDKLEDGLEGVQSQSVASVIGHMTHKHIDLQKNRGDQSILDFEIWEEYIGFTMCYFFFKSVPKNFPRSDPIFTRLPIFSGSKFC